MPTPPTYYFQGPDGKVVAISDPDTAASLANDSDYAPASAQTIVAYQADKQKQEQYGGIGQQLLTGAEGLAKGATLGVSTLGEEALGVSPESIKAREEVNPTIAGVSDVAGTIGSAFLAPEFSGPGLLARGAEVATAGLGRGVAGTAARIGLEGAGYGAANVAHELSLGDPNLNGEHIASEIGTDALIGVALGTAGKATQSIMSNLVGKMSGSEIAEKIDDFLARGQAASGLKVAGGKPIVKLLAREGIDDPNQFSLDVQKWGYVEPFSTPKSIIAKTQEAMQTEGDIIKAYDAQLDSAVASGQVKPPDIPEILKKVETETKVKPIPPGQGALDNIPAEEEPVDPWLDFSNDVMGIGTGGAKPKGKYTVIVRRGSEGTGQKETPWYTDHPEHILREMSHPWGDNVHGAVQRVIDSDGKVVTEEDLRKLIGGNAKSALAEDLGQMHATFDPAVGVPGVTPPASTWADVRHIEQTLGDETAARPLDSATAKVYGEARAVVADAIDEAVTQKEAQIPLKDYQAAQAKFRAASILNRVMKASADIPDAGSGLTLSQTAFLAGHPVAAGVTLAAKSLGPSVAMKSLGGLRALLAAGQAGENTIGALSSLHPIVKNLNNTLQQAVTSGALKSGALAASADIVKNIQAVQSLANNPDKMIQAVQDQINGMDAHAPQTSQAVALAMSRQIAALAQAAPNLQPQGLLGTPRQPSKAELASFQQAQEAVKDPIGTLFYGTPAQKQIIYQACPAQAKALQNQTMSWLIDHPDDFKKMPYRQQQAIRGVLSPGGDPVEYGKLQRIQAAIAGAPKSGGPTPAKKNTIGGAKALAGIAERTTTGLQSVDKQLGGGD